MLLIVGDFLNQMLLYGPAPAYISATTLRTHTLRGAAVLNLLGGINVLIDHLRTCGLLKLLRTVFCILLGLCF